MFNLDSLKKMRILPLAVGAMAVLSSITIACKGKSEGETIEFHSTNKAGSGGCTVENDPACTVGNSEFALNGDYAVIFNDSNKRQWCAAEPIGIEPITDLNSIWRLRRPLVYIQTNKDFVVEELTHSHPYLVPEADSALHAIGRRFSTKAKEATGNDYRVRVTSVLRTKSQVQNLQRTNKNAVDSSVHMLGTTVDISYNVFADEYGRTVDNPKLKPILAQVLYDMRNEGYIWVKYEKKQPCFHLSARKR